MQSEHPRYTDSDRTASSTASSRTGDPGPELQTEPALSGQRLELAYSETGAPVIDGESVSLPDGAVTAIVGPNGSGKSTLLKGLARQLEPRAGTVYLDGSDIYELDSKSVAKQLGLLSQESTSPDSITVEELVYYGRYPHRDFFESISEDGHQAVRNAIELAGVGHLRDRELGSLSGGQKQLAWIAMVLAQETDILLLDEPTTFLDLHHQLTVMEIVESLNHESEVTIGMVLHDINQAARHSEYVIAVDDGTIYDRGPPQEVVTDDLLADVFRVDATVEWSGSGPSIVPTRPL